MKAFHIFNSIKTRVAVLSRHTSGGIIKIAHSQLGGNFHVARQPHHDVAYIP